ncbi:Ger(x)C family spore germination protein [Paenibacillus sp. HWE-109]|uniref:Ger(x)C family spore germination protein n=1 Tax=Paenibacillus sp. HWE-109 TaxID=1306526 RepID=UPI001EDE6851|nr:Ger(x)C family spore germination protein [Paenibacillus sp. HWE-109]UKS27411.1 Ger(x)C family spore germination protein [Paenibacillus sp. HWE-109]
MIIRSFGHTMRLSWGLGLLALLLTGCWDRNEVNDLALITGAAIDKHDNKTIELTVQIFVPRGSSNISMDSGLKGSGGGSQSSYVKSAFGINLADALSHLQEKLPRKLFWGHAEVIIFGEAVARSGIRDDLDYFMRAPQPRERAYMYVSKGEARNILELNTKLERNTAESLREISKSKLTLSVTLADLAQMLGGGSRAAALPYMELTAPLSSNNPDKSESFINATAVFKNDKMIGKIDDSTTRGALWLRNEIKQAVVTVVPENTEGTVSANLIKSKTTLEPIIENGKWRMNVWIHTEDDALQNTTELNLVEDSNAVKTVEKALNADIENRVRSALDKAQHDLQADIFGFAGEFHRAYPKEWKKNQQRWDELFPTVEVAIHSDAKMLRPGLSSIRATQPE